MVKNPPAKQETRVRFLGQEDPLEKVMATHSSILAWEMPRIQDKVRALEERPRQRRTWGTGGEERRDLRRRDFRVLSHSPLT